MAETYRVSPEPHNGGVVVQGGTDGVGQGKGGGGEIEGVLFGWQDIKRGAEPILSLNS